MATTATLKSLSVNELRTLMKSDPSLDLIDVRTPGEYETVHASGARSFPLDRLDPAAVMAGRQGKSEPVYVICKSGGRSRQACAKFLAAGLDNVVNIEGGTEAWVSAGLPVEQRGRNVLPLDRQVQMTAGLIGLAGTILGASVNPWFYWVPGMVGAGLTMAGLTGFCPMGILMARMPWNQGSCSVGNCSHSSK